MPSLKIHETLYAYEQNEKLIRQKKENWTKSVRSSIVLIIENLTKGVDFGLLRPEFRDNPDGFWYELHRTYDKVDFPGGYNDFSYIDFKQGFDGKVSVWFYIHNPKMEKSYVHVVFDPVPANEFPYAPFIEEIIVEFIKALHPGPDNNIGHTSYL